MSSTYYNSERDRDELFGKSKRLADVTVVQFRINHLRHLVDARQLRLAPGDQVIVDAHHGPAIAEVVEPVERRLVDTEIPQILRQASSQDIERADKNEALEKRAHRFALECIRNRRLEMKLVRTQYMQDGSRIVFYFSADGRIDFRALVRDLASEFRTRIEMRQIGVRDGAQMIGGIGPCGRELCCSTFLDHFQPVSIRMARQQGLTLNPSKISGMCGRLMCCLVYEQKIYRRLKSSLPRAGDEVRTEKGPATVCDVDVINRRVTVELTDDQRRITLPINDVAAATESDTDISSHDGARDEKLWDGDPPRKK